MCMCAYVGLAACMFRCVCLCVYMYVVWACVHVRVHAWACMCVGVCVSVCTHMGVGVMGQELGGAEARQASRSQRIQ